MFYLKTFLEKHNHYIGFNADNKSIYIHYFYDNYDNDSNCIGIVIEDISSNDKIKEQEVINLVDTQVFALLHHAFNCKNINSLLALNCPNKNLFNIYKGKVTISQLLFALENESKSTLYSKYIYNVYKWCIYLFKKLIFGDNIKFINRLLEVKIESSDNKIYDIKIIPATYINKFIDANLVKKIYKIYQER